MGLPFFALHKFTPFNSSGQGNYFLQSYIFIDILIEEIDIEEIK